MDKIKKQYIYFLDNKDSLIKKYPEKILIISDNFEVFAFESIEDAYTFDVKTLGLAICSIKNAANQQYLK